MGLVFCCGEQGVLCQDKVTLFVNVPVHWGIFTGRHLLWQYKD
uniref:Uncharacterized protein n=1 Tax=Arundo donax TaxID=35708 RepID=A0A0A9B8Q3_ARUDO